jgi:YVTN family beta-propeller protein
VQFRLLGLLEVIGDDGQTVEIVRGHESALLALLLLHANEAISPERILEELWPAGAPENARKSIHIYISHLRKAIGPGRIETTPAGYLLRLTPDELDVNQFESLATEGRDALARGAADDAEKLFDRALALWRIAPLADFRFDSFAQSDARRLEELHNAVVADRVDARIARGRAQLVIQELDALIDQAPLWERPRGQLMRALYLTSRQADALELYRITRDLLHDELGIEPGPELQRLERQILNHDPELGEPTPPPRPLLRQRRFQLAALVAAVTAIAAVFATLALSGGGSSSSTRPNTTNPSSAVSTIDPRTNRVVSTTTVGRYPNRIAYDRDAVWVLNSEDKTITRLDPHTHAAVHIFAPGSTPTDVFAFAGALWVTTPLSNRVLRLDTSTDNITDRFAARNPLFLTSDATRLWIIGENAVTLDPTTRKRSLAYDPHLPNYPPNTDANPGDATTLDGSLFLDAEGNYVIRINPTTHTAQRSNPLQTWGPSRIVEEHGALWLTGRGNDGDYLQKIDPSQLKPKMKIRVGSWPVGVAYGANSLWVANSGDGTVMRINPTNGHILKTIHVGGTPYDLAFTHGLAWVTIL